MNLTRFGYRADFDENDRIVKQEYIEFEGKKHFVSTVDLGLNHRFGAGEPLWYETMIFEGEDRQDLYCDRYTTKEEALAAHEKLVEDINSGKYVLNGYFTLKEETSDGENTTDRRN
jgi:hypothetical protein